jgi:hypothetical protein
VNGSGLFHIFVMKLWALRLHKVINLCKDRLLRCRSWNHPVNIKLEYWKLFMTISPQHHGLGVAVICMNELFHNMIQGMGLHKSRQTAEWLILRLPHRFSMKRIQVRDPILNFQIRNVNQKFFSGVSPLLRFHISGCSVCGGRFNQI